MSRLLMLLFFLAVFSCKSDKRYHDNSSFPEVTSDVKAVDYKEEVMAMRTEKDELFSKGKNSPLPAGLRKGFSGLNYFTIDTLYCLSAIIERVAVPQMIALETTTGEVMVQEIYGEVVFKLGGEEHRLTVYRDRDLQKDPEFANYLFLPFTDLTNGEETYGGGRYLDLEDAEGDTLELDFNLAYSPYCAYNSKYSCPLVPAVNHLKIAIRAGEKILP